MKNRNSSAFNSFNSDFQDYVADNKILVSVIDEFGGIENHIITPDDMDSNENYYMNESVLEKYF